MVNRDNIYDAVENLIDFRHNYCLNVKETDQRNDLTFRCKECPFAFIDGDIEKCKVKTFFIKYADSDQLERSAVMR